MRVCITSLLLGLAAIALCSSTSQASRRKHEKPSKKQIEIVNRTISIVPYVKGGFLTGAVTKYVDNNNRPVYGGGVRFERFISPVVRVDLGGEALYGCFADSGQAKVRALSLAMGSCFMFTPRSQSGLYARGEIGITSIKAVETKIDQRTYKFVRIGLGQSYYFRPTVTTRIEFFYTTILSNDKHRFPYIGKVDFNVTYFGLQIGVLFGL